MSFESELTEKTPADYLPLLALISGHFFELPVHPAVIVLD